MNSHVKIAHSFPRANSDLYQKKEESHSKEGSHKKKPIVGIFDKVMTFSLFMIFFGIPVFFTNLTFQGIVFEKQIYFYFWTLLALVVWASKSVIVGEMNIRRTPLDFAILGFWLVCVVSSFFSVDKWHSFWGFFGDPSRGALNVTALIVMYYLIVSNFDAKRFKWMIIGIISSSIIVSLWTFLVVFGIKFLPESLRKISPMSLTGTITGVRMLIGASIPLFMSVIFKINEDGVVSKRAKRIITPLMLLVIIIDLVTLTALYEKVSSLIVLVGVGIFLVYVLAHIVKPKDNVTWVPMAVFVLTMIVFMVGPNNIARVNVPLEVSPSNSISWEIAKGGFKKDLFLGSGLSSYGYDFSMYRPQSFNENSFYSLRFYQGGSLFFEAISTIGLVGIIALILVTLSFIGVSFYLLSKGKNKSKVFSLGLISALMILIAGAFLLRLEGTILIMTALLGALAVATMFFEDESEVNYINLSLKTSPKFALALAFVFIVISAGVAVMVVFIGKVYVADVYAGRGAKQSNITEDGSIRMITNAYALNKREGRYALRAGQEYMALANNEVLTTGATADEEKVRKVQLYANRSIEFSKEGVRLMPSDVLAVSVLAQVYESAGAYVPEMLTLSEDNYRKALELEPQNPVFYLKIGQFKLNLASKEKDEDKKQALLEDAKDNLNIAIGKKKNFAPAYYNLSLVQEALKDVDGAITSSANAITLDNSSTDYLFNLGRLYQSRAKDGDNEKARDVYKYILTVSPNHVNANFSLGVIYEKLKQKDLAITQYEKTIDLVTNDDIKKQLNTMIENVKSGKGNVSVEPIKEESAKQDNQNLVGPEQAQTVNQAQTTPQTNTTTENSTSTPTQTNNQ